MTRNELCVCVLLFQSNLDPVQIKMLLRGSGKFLGLVVRQIHDRSRSGFEL